MTPQEAEALHNDLRLALDAPGLTKREYAAIHLAAALETRLSVYATVETSMIAARAVELADAVLKEAGK